MKAKEVMGRHVISVSPEMTLQEVAKLFDENKISGAPVIDNQGKIVGVISQTDLVRHDRESPRDLEVSVYFKETNGGPPLPRGFHTESPDLTLVREVMSPTVISAEKGAELKEIARLMLHNGIHRIIITHEGRLQGIVTSMDVLRAFVKE